MTLRIREPALEEHAAGAALLAHGLGFAPRDAVPAWLMHAAAEAGGLVLGAFDDERGEVVGWSFAVAARRDGAHELLSCGLAVAPSHRSAGVGRALKEAQREWALERGIDRIRWTADPLAAPALGLYLGRLGARVTRYRAALYDRIRDGDGIPQDDVEVVWDLRAGRATVRANGRLRVELPYRRSRLSAADHLGWRLSVRERLSAALEDGYAGVDVQRDESAQRCWMVLVRASA